MMKAVGFERGFAKTFENLAALSYEKNRLKNRMGGSIVGTHSKNQTDGSLHCFR